MLFMRTIASRSQAEVDCLRVFYKKVEIKFMHEATTWQDLELVKKKDLVGVLQRGRRID